MSDEFKSLVEFQLDLPKNDPEFTSFSNNGVDWIFHTEYGYVHLAVPQGGCEYFCNELCEFALIIKLIWIRKQDRNKGYGRKLLRKIMEIYEHTNVVLLLYAYPVEISGTRVPPDTIVVDDLKLQRKLVNFYHSEEFEVAKYESVYIPYFLMEMIKRHSFHKVTPILMFKAAKMVPHVVRKELEAIQLDEKVWAAEYMRDDQFVDKFCPWKYMSDDYLL